MSYILYSLKGLDMHPIVEILLARMKSNPDDFMYKNGEFRIKGWQYLLTKYADFFTEEERDAIETEYKRIRVLEREDQLQKLTEEVYELLTEPESNIKYTGGRGI